MINALTIRTTQKRTSIQQRMMMFILEFTNDFQHISGSSNIVADTLSRVEIEAIEPFSIKTIADAQKNDQVFVNEMLHQYPDKLKIMKISGYQIVVHVDDKHVRPIVPPNCREIVFKMVHGLSHPSVNRTKNLVSEKYWWPNMNKDVGVMAKNCLDCQSSKIQRHTHVPQIPRILSSFSQQKKKIREFHFFLTISEILS